MVASSEKAFCVLVHKSYRYKSTKGYARLPRWTSSSSMDSNKILDLKAIFLLFSTNKEKNIMVLPINLRLQNRVMIHLPLKLFAETTCLWQLIPMQTPQIKQKNTTPISFYEISSQSEK